MFLNNPESVKRIEELAISSAKHHNDWLMQQGKPPLPKYKIK
jgi:hypothetical protein